MRGMHFPHFVKCVSCLIRLQPVWQTFECTSSSRSISDVLAASEHNLLTHHILWSGATYDLNLSFQREAAETKEYPPLQRLRRSGQPTKNEGCISLAEIRNALIHDHKRLTHSQYQFFPALALCGCPAMLQHTSTRLTDRAARMLLQKARQIERYLGAAKHCARPSQQRVFRGLFKGKKIE